MFKHLLTSVLSRALTGYTATEVLNSHFRTENTPYQIPRFFIPDNPWPLDASFNSNAPFYITARFRSGSTLLWRLLRACPGIKAYYEPLNPRKWFCPSTRGFNVDETHQHVTDYWHEYQNISVKETPWEDRWASNDIYLSPLQPELKLQRYLQLLLDKSDQRPVLQFNRMDFRLAWLRQCFPEIPILHLHRNPRDQWLSTFQRSLPPPPDDISHASKSEFYADSWAADLSKTVPIFRDRDEFHSYELSFLLWRLSEVYANNTATESIAYEDLVKSPEKTIDTLSKTLHLPELADATVTNTINKASVGRWESYASNDWFLEKEHRVNLLLQRFVFDTEHTT